MRHTDGGDEMGGEDSKDWEELDPSIRKKRILTIRVATEYRNWLDEFSITMRISVTDLIDHALVHYAELQNFRDPPRR